MLYCRKVVYVYGHTTIKMHFSREFADMTRAMMGDEYDAFLQSCSKPSPKAYRVNTLKVSAGQYAFDFQGPGIPWCKTGFQTLSPVGDTLEHFLGLVYVQEPASMVSAEVLSPTCDDVVLDMAAAPGSKTTQMAALMENRGCIIANEVDAKRIKSLRFNLNRMGVANTVVTNMNGTRFNPNILFDKILLDAPCSNAGQLRDNPDALANWNHARVKECSRLQKLLIGAAAGLLKDGGTLVYSTCTFSPEENEDVVDYVLEEHGLVVADIEGEFKSHPGLSEWNGKRFAPGIEKTKRLYPQDNDTGGFYVAKLTK
jgi:NOL1/NOP2/sun family putative RNA methylase